MSSTSIALPRGLLLGACFAILLAAPLFLAISLDSVSSGFSGHFHFGHASNPRPWPVTSNAEFFNGQINVRVSFGFRPSLADPATRTAGANEPSRTGDSPVPQPVKVFQIRVENRSNHELSVNVLEAKSEFGDLSAGLQTIRLAPGQMTQTGVALKPNASPTESSPVQVRLRVGNREEKRELILPPAGQS